MTVYGNGKWILTGPDIETTEIRQDNSGKDYTTPCTLVEFVYGEDDGKTLKVMMYKDVFDGIRNGIYDAQVVLHLNGEKEFRVVLNNEDEEIYIPYQPYKQEGSS